MTLTLKMKELKIIARIKTDFPTKFGIPRQSGLIPSLKGKIIFEPEYRDSTALRGLDGFSHIWLLWEFSENKKEEWTPTVRPPRLGGNKRIGVFATRSPFRPNQIGLSSVKLEGIERDEKYGDVLIVSGSDLLDGTPIYDIKPYVPYTDSHIDAVGGFSEEVYGDKLEVFFPDEAKNEIPDEDIEVLSQILASDPRPAYKKDSDREYGFEYAEYSVKFKVKKGIACVIKVEKIQ